MNWGQWPQTSLRILRSPDQYCDSSGIARCIFYHLLRYCMHDCSLGGRLEKAKSPRALHLRVSHQPGFRRSQGHCPRGQSQSKRPTGKTRQAVSSDQRGLRCWLGSLLSCREQLSCLYWTISVRNHLGEEQRTAMFRKRGNDFLILAARLAYV